MQDFNHNSIDFAALMQELLQLERVCPDHPDLPMLKERVQRELDRQKAVEEKPVSEPTVEDPDLSSKEAVLQSQEILAVLEGLYSSTEARRAESGHSEKSTHRSSSHRSSHSRSSSRSSHRHHRHRTVASPTSIPTEGIRYEDLIYPEDAGSAKHTVSSLSSKTDSNSAAKDTMSGRLTHSEPVSDTVLPSVSETPDPVSEKGPASSDPVSSTSPTRKEKSSHAGKTRMYQKDLRGWRSLRTWQKTVSVVFGVILILLLAGTVSVHQFMNRIQRVDPEDIPELSKEGYEDLLKLSPEELEVLRETDPDAESLIIDKKDRYGVGDIDLAPMQRDDVLNILLIGQDRRKGDKGQMRSDSMILVTIDKTSKEMKLTSLMRDMYVPVPGYGYGMINATLLNGGMKLLNATIEQDFGVHIDGDIQIDFYRFIKLMDLIGPLGLELNADEVKFFKENNGWNYKVGYNELNSEQVLAYARTRSVGRSDWERTDRQRKVIMAIYSKLKKSDIPSLMKFTYDAMPLITTNINKNTDLINIVYTILSNRMPITKSSRIPLEGTYTQQIKNGVLHVLVPELRPNSRALQKITFG